MGATAEDLRAAALALPEAVEVPHFGAPSFRVNSKIFAQIVVKDGARAILKLPRERQELLAEARPETFQRAFWGRTVFHQVVLDRIEPAELAELVRDSWREVAPRRLTKG